MGIIQYSKLCKHYFLQYFQLAELLIEALLSFFRIHYLRAAIIANR